MPVSRENLKDKLSEAVGNMLSQYLESVYENILTRSFIWRIKHDLSDLIKEQMRENLSGWMSRKRADWTSTSIVDQILDLAQNAYQALDARDGKQPHNEIRPLISLTRDAFHPEEFRPRQSEPPAKRSSGSAEAVLVPQSGVANSQPSKHCAVILLPAHLAPDSNEGMQLFKLFETIDRNIRPPINFIFPHVGNEMHFIAAVRAKQWTDEQVKSIDSLPGMLVTPVSFEDFDPRSQSYIYIHLSPYVNEFGQVRYEALAQFLEALTKWIKERRDLAYELNSYQIGVDRKRVLETIEIKPSIFGISVDARKLFDIIR
jgi:hypothetical protein